MVSENEVIEIRQYIDYVGADGYSESVTNILDHLERFGDITERQDKLLVSYLLNTVREEFLTNDS